MQQESDKNRDPKADAGQLRNRIVFGVVLVGLAFVLWFGLGDRPKAGWPESMTPGSAAGLNVLLITLDTTRASNAGRETCFGGVGCGRHWRTTSGVS